MHGKGKATARNRTSRHQARPAGIAAGGVTANGQAAGLPRDPAVLLQRGLATGSVAQGISTGWSSETERTAASAIARARRPLASVA